MCRHHPRQAEVSIVTMLSMIFKAVLLLQLCSAQFIITPGMNPFLVRIRPPMCGPCPPVSCIHLPPIVLGFCCGCALPIDRVPLVCPANLLCPPPSPLLCGDYNYLMDCCC